MTHDEVKLAIGAFALGALDEDEAAEVRGHLATCPVCRQEYDDLRGLPALLGLVSAAEVVAGPELGSQAGSDRLLAQVAAERKAKHRRGLASRFAGALALAATASVIGFVVAEGTAEEIEPPDFTLAATDQVTGIWAEVALNEVGWGTKIELQLSGVTIGENCRLVAVTAASDEAVAGDWTVPDTDRDYITIPGSVGFSPQEIDHFDVITAEGELLLRIPLAAGSSAP